MLEGNGDAEQAGPGEKPRGGRSDISAVVLLQDLINARIDQKWGLVFGTTVQSLPYFFLDTSHLGLALWPGRGGESP